MGQQQENIRFYEDLRQVPMEAQKSFDNGKFKGTDINPMWRIKRMTEVFGPCGIGWYYEVVNRSIEQSSDKNVICAFIGINLYVKVDGEWSKPIYGEGGNTMSTWNRKYSCVDTSDEAYKMALTDAFSNATKQLGLGADIWFANDKNHSTKYDLQAERKADNDSAPTPVVATTTTNAAPKNAAKGKAVVEEKAQELANAVGIDNRPVPKTEEEKVLYAAKSKKELRALLINNSWVSNKALVDYANSLSTNLPEDIAA